MKAGLILGVIVVHLFSDFRVFCFVLSFVCFVVDHGSSAPNKDIVIFRCGDGEVLYTFAHIFMKNFQGLYNLPWVRDFCSFLN